MTVTREESRVAAGQRSETSTDARPVVRLWEIDALRGIAILLMVVYHFTYDLDQFGDFDIGANTGGWQTFANGIAFMFVFLVGTSLVLSYSRSAPTTDDEWSLVQKYLLRGLRIFGYGMLITVAVWLFAPGGLIIFGILHLIGFSIVLAYPFLRWPKAALPVGLGIFLFGMLVDLPRVDFPWLVWLGFRPEGIGMMYDYRPVVPWFGAALLGISAGYLLYQGGQRRFRVPDIGSLAPIRLLSKMGRYSLFIYLVHQPIILLVLEVTGVIDLGLF